MNRIEYIDTAKAFAILLVVIGHCYWIKDFDWIHYGIYSFHMPLFFIISGFFIKELPLKTSIPKYLKAYIKPLALTSVLALILVLIGDWIRNDSYLETVKAWCRYLVYMNGDYESFNHARLGPLWFLFALFWGSVTFSFLQKYDSVNFLITSVGLFFLAVLVYRYKCLPFAFSEGMLSVFFLLLGNMIKKHSVLDDGKITKWCWWLIAAVWLLSIPLGPFFFKTISFGKIFITVIGSIAGTLIILKLCKFLKTKMLRWTGMTTLYILCGHVLSFNILKLCGVDYNDLPFSPSLNFAIEAVCQITFALTLGFVLTLIPLYKKAS